MTIEDQLRSVVPSWVQIIPIYSGELGAHNEIISWVVEVVGSRQSRGSGETVQEALETAIASYGSKGEPYEQQWLDYGAACVGRFVSFALASTDDPGVRDHLTELKGAWESTEWMRQ